MITVFIYNGKLVKNIKENNKAYLLYHNGVSTEKMVSIFEGLKLEKEWDYVVTQQASHFSGKIETYEPYFSFIYDYVKDNTKFRKFGWQETWAYGPNMNAPENRFGDYNRDSELMYNEIHKCVSLLLDKMPDLFVINSGDIVRNAIPVINADLYDDYDFHMSSAGCYLIGTNFVKLLLEDSIRNVYIPDGHNLGKDLCTEITNFVNNQSGFKKNYIAK